MPILKSAKKRMRQTRIRRERRLPYRTRAKTMMTKVLHLCAQGKDSEAEKALKEAFAALDTAAKKHIIHWKTAGRRKSRLSRAVASLKK